MLEVEFEVAAVLVLAWLLLDDEAIHGKGYRQFMWQDKMRG
jgi:hypothetical protein